MDVGANGAGLMKYEPYKIRAVKQKDGEDTFIFVEMRFDNGGYWCATVPEIMQLIGDLAKAAGKAEQMVWRLLPEPEPEEPISPADDCNEDCKTGTRFCKFHNPKP